MLSKSLCLSTCFFGFPKRDLCLDGTLKQKNLFFQKYPRVRVDAAPVRVRYNWIERVIRSIENTSLITYGW